MDFGIPCKEMTFAMNWSAMSLAESVVRPGAKWTIFIKRSTKTVILSKPNLVLGNCTMKSMEVDSQGPSDMGRGCNNPPGFCVESLLCWHSSQEAMNFSISSSIFSQ